MGLCLFPGYLPKKKPLTAEPKGSEFFGRTTRGKRQQKTADHSPDRVSLLHKGGESIMAQRVRKPHRGKNPSSSGQLPVPMALNARLSTLFVHTIPQMTGKVKGLWKKMETKICAL